MVSLITESIANADAESRYLNAQELEVIEQAIRNEQSPGDLRIRTADAIRQNAAQIVQAAVAQCITTDSLDRSNRGIRVTRRYAACIRDLDYLLRYATYAMVVGDPMILRDQVLKGLKETYAILDVQVEYTVQALQAMKTVISQQLGEPMGQAIETYLNYLSEGLQ